MISSLFGIAVIALPAGIVTAGFMEEVSHDKDKEKDKEKDKKMQEAMKMSRKMRYALVMIISVLMNAIFFTIASSLGLPFWLDLSGTAFAALLLEPAAGLLVGFANNFYEAIYFQNSSDIIYYAVSAVVAILVGVNMRRDGKIKWKRTLSTIVLLILSTSFLTTLLNFWQTGGTPIEKWELFYYEFALSLGLPHFLSVFFGITMIKLYDILVSTLIVGFFYIILPKTLKFSKNELENMH